mgnify:CR=1 FL=1
MDDKYKVVFIIMTRCYNRLKQEEHSNEFDNLTEAIKFVNKLAKRSFVYDIKLFWGNSLLLEI